MGERLKEVNLKEARDNNPAALEVLKSIYSIYAHYNKLPVILRELKYVSEEQIPEEFLDGRIIFAEDIDGDSLLLINPELIRRGVKKYVRYTDIYKTLNEDEDEKLIIAVSEIAKSDKLIEKILALDDTTRMKQIKERGKNAFKQSLKAGGKVAKGAKTAGEKALIPAGKTIGRGAVKAGKGFVNFMDIIG